MFKGSCVALVTPMTEEGEVDYAAWEQLLKWHLEQNTDAIVIGGTTGEVSTLTGGEWSQLITLAVSIVKNSKKPIPVIAGTGSNSTQETIFNTQEAKALGCDGALIVTPYYNKPTQEGLYLHYKKIAQAVDLPIILYNVPHRTACDLSVETTIRLSYLPNIIGIKDATGDLTRVTMYKKDAKPGFILYTGDDESVMAFMTLGGEGVISVAANIAPKAMHDLCQAVLENDLMQAESINHSLKKLCKNLFLESNPIPVKWALHAMGRISCGIRLPLTVLSEQYHASLYNDLQNLEVLEIAGDHFDKNHCV